MSVLDPWRQETSYIGSILHALESKRERDNDDVYFDEDRKIALGSLANVTPDMFVIDVTRKLFTIVKQEAGENGTIVHSALIDKTQKLGDVGLQEALLDALSNAYASELALREKNLIGQYREQRFRELLQKSQHWLTSEEGMSYDKQARAANRLALRLMGLYTEQGEIEDVDTMLDILKDRAIRKENVSVPFPWPKLERFAGPIVPGEVVGVSAYPNAGKSTFAVELFRYWVRRNYPVLAFPTEMGLQWFERVLASDAGVPQWRAEKHVWDPSSEELQRYLAAVEDWRVRKDMYHILPRATVSPEEIIASARIVRQRWPGIPTVVLVDHAHRLDYGEFDADGPRGAAQATKLFKNAAREDKDGGLIFVSLYQPRKPDMGFDSYGPIQGHQIGGSRGTWTELDIHLSPFRCWVECYINGMKTAWGTPLAKSDPRGRPIHTKADESDPGRKIDDEHFYVSIDKRRVGGKGPNVMLGFDPVTGRIYEEDEG